MAAPYIGVFELGKTLRESVEIAREEQKTLAQTAAVIRSTGGAAHVSAKEVEEYALKLSTQVGISHTIIQANENLLLTFTQVKNRVGEGNDIFDQATKTVLDMSVALKEDGKAASIQLGKALNDPIKGATALRRVGVQLTQQQQDSIKTFVKQGNVLGAQKIILGELNREFGGSAAAQATAGDKMRVTWENIRLALGNKLLPVIDKVENGFSTFVGGVTGNVKQMDQSARPKLELFGLGVRAMFEAFKNGDVTSTGFVGTMERIGVAARSAVAVIISLAHTLMNTLAQAWKTVGPMVLNFGQFLVTTVIPAVIGVTKAIAQLVDGALKGLGSWIQSHQTLVRTFVVMIGTFYGVIKLVTTAIKIWTAITKAYIAVQAALDAVMDANPIMLVVAAIAALVVGFIYAYKHSKTFRDIIDGIGRVLKRMFNDVYGFLKTWGPLILAVLMPVIGIPLLIWQHWRQIKDFMVDAFHAVVGFLKTWGPVILAVIAPFIGIPLLIFLHWKQIVDFLHRVWDDIVGFVQHWYHLILDILLPFLSVPALIYAHWRQIIDFMVKVWDGAVQAVRNGIATTIRVVRNGLDDIVNFFQKLPGRIVRFFASAGRLLVSAGRAYIQGLWNGLLAVWSTVSGWFRRLPGRILSFYAGAGRLLLNVGRSIIQGLFNGLTTIWRNVADWFSRVPGRVVGFFHDLPHKLYAAGKDIFVGLWTGLKAIWNNVVGWFAHLPGKILSVLGIHSPPDWAIDAGKHMMKGILKGIIEHSGGALAFMDRWQEAMAKKSRNRFDVGIFQIPGLGGIFSGGKTSGKGSMGHPWDWIAQAMTLTHAPSTWMDALFRRIMFESSGNPNAINLTDANAAAGHPSKGIMQMIDSTFRGYALGGHGNIWNPVDNIASAIRYIASRYGSISAIDPPVQGYKTGAWDIARDQLAYLHKREMVVPATTADQVRRGAAGGGRGSANDIDKLIAALLAAFGQMEIRFDGDGLARLVSRKQNANSVKGVRR